jgi:endonuclease/exonuclease/phosphatase family metal-dependent hydrolase
MSPSSSSFAVTCGSSSHTIALPLRCSSTLPQESVWQLYQLMYAIEYLALASDPPHVQLQPPRNANTSIQILQGWLITQGVSVFLSRTCITMPLELKLFFGPDAATPIIWCGDFNTLPGSALYKYLHEGKLTLDLPPSSPTSPPLDTRKPVVSHDLSLRSAFSIHREPLTHRTTHFNGTIDYIIVTQNSLQVCALLYPNEQAAKQGIPSENEPSDHLPLVAQLAFT